MQTNIAMTLVGYYIVLCGKFMGSSALLVKRGGLQIFLMVFGMQKVNAAYAVTGENLLLFFTS
jgi:hypothetical protein